MIALICFVLAVLASPFKSNIRLEAENAVLRHQLIVLRRKLKGRARLTNNDRWFFVQLYRWFPSARHTGRTSSSIRSDLILVHTSAMCLGVGPCLRNDDLGNTSLTHRSTCFIPRPPRLRSAGR